MKFNVLINYCPQFVRHLSIVCVLILLFGDGRPELSCQQAFGSP